MKNSPTTLENIVPNFAPMISRRGFLTRSLATGAALGFPSLHAAGANEGIRVAIVGIGNKGTQHIGLFNGLKDVKVVAICDPDRKALDECARKNFDGKVATHVDLREVFDRKDVDAVCIATPNHWHALAAIWACQAGKDVYLEKPVSHNIWEGRQIVKAGLHHQRIVQTGTQSRSAEGTREFIADLHAGRYGKIKSARGLCYKRRTSIGKVAGPQTVPDHIDYNLWSGPREAAPIMRQQFHYDWHWQWPYGNGDLGNQGVHQMDLCRWALGETGLPRGVVTLGGRFGYDDDGQTPNTQTVLFDYETAPLVFEVRNLPETSDAERMGQYRGGRVSMVIECEAGYFVGADGGVFFDPNGKKVKGYSSGLGRHHHQNFVDAMRSRKSSDLHADILEGHLSSSLCHLGNISYRVGSSISREQLEAQCKGDGIRAEVFDRLLRHALVHEKDFTQRKMILGPSLSFDSATERFTGEHAVEANALIRDSYRGPFVVPEDL